MEYFLGSLGVPKTLRTLLAEFFRDGVGPLAVDGILG